MNIFFWMLFLFFGWKANHLFGIFGLDRFSALLSFLWNDEGSNTFHLLNIKGRKLKSLNEVLWGMLPCFCFFSFVMMKMVEKTYRMWFVSAHCPYIEFIVTHIFTVNTNVILLLKYIGFWMHIFGWEKYTSNKSKPRTASPVINNVFISHPKYPIDMNLHNYEPKQFE